MHGAHTSFNEYWPVFRLTDCADNDADRNCGYMEITVEEFEEDKCRKKRRYWKMWLEVSTVRNFSSNNWLSLSSDGPLTTWRRVTAFRLGSMQPMKPVKSKLDTDMATATRPFSRAVEKLEGFLLKPLLYNCSSPISKNVTFIGLVNFVSDSTTDIIWPLTPTFKNANYDVPSICNLYV